MIRQEDQNSNGIIPLKALFGAALLSLTLSACGGSSGDSGQETDPPPVVPDPDPGPDPTPDPDPDPTPDPDPDPTPDPDPDPTPDPDPDPTPDPDPDPDPEPEPDPDVAAILQGDAVYFNGLNAYGEMADWRADGDFRLVAWLDEVNTDPSATTVLVSDDDGDYLAFSHDSVEGRWNGQTVTLTGPFEFNRTRYLEITVQDGRLSGFDGESQASISSGAVDADAGNYRWLYRLQDSYSIGGLQALALVDLDNAERTRTMTFDQDHGVVAKGNGADGTHLLHNLASADWRAIEGNVTAPAPHATNQAEWDAAFDRYYADQRPLMNVTHGNDQLQFAWEGHYWLRAYVRMAKAYGDTKYLDYAVELADHLFYYTDEKRVERGELNIHNQPYSDLAPKLYLNTPGLPVPGWRRPYNGAWRNEALTDGMILNAIMRLVDHIKSENLAQYMEQADGYISQAERIVRAHDSSFSTTKNGAIQGSYFYVNPGNTDYGDSGLYSNPLPFNHNMTLGTAMIYLDKWGQGNGDMGQKAREILGFYMDNLKMESGDLCQWNYQFLADGGGKMEDVNHAHLDVGFMVVARQEGMLDNDEPLRCMANTLVQRVFLAPAMASFGVDGSGISSTWDQVAVGYDWIDLQGVDPRVGQVADHILRHYGDLSWYRPYLAAANSLYWKSLSQ